MKFGLKEKDIEAINTVFSKYGSIHQVLIYGSRVKGNYREGSDIDLVIVGDLEFSDQMQLESQLDDLLLPYKIDLSQLHQISNDHLLAHIQRRAQAFYDPKHFSSMGGMAVNG